MQQREASGSHWSTVLFVVCLAGGIAVAALVMWPRADTVTVPATPRVLKAPVNRGPVDAAAARSEQRPEQGTERVAVAVLAASEPPLVFAECVARMCEMGLRVAELAQEDEIDEARALDTEVRTLLERVLQEFADAGERSISMVIEMAGTPDENDESPAQNTRLGVLQVLVQGDLARRNKLAGQIEDRSRIDALAQFVLDSMPIGTLNAQMGNRCLNKGPFLRGVHEQSVLNLLQLANKDQFPRDIATNMLLTLWDNMKAHGERTSAELTQLALMRLDSSDPSQILAACRQLLADPHYRAVALAWLRERKDLTLAGDIAELAAQELPVRDALEVLRELAPLLGHRRGTYLALGIRDPEVIADAYRQHLATNNQPDIRRELLMSVGMLPNAQGLKLAELALTNDPSPAVRIQAMFVYTIHGQPAMAEQAVSQLLDEPIIANSQLHLDAIVLALENLEHGDPNTIARLGMRLKGMSLSKQSRESLTQLMARSLPNGGATARTGGR